MGDLITFLDDLIAFLNARLGEDEAAANAAIKDSSPRWHADGRWLFSELSPGGQLALMSESRNGSAVALAACYDPARVLREVEAKRALIRSIIAADIASEVSDIEISYFLVLDLLHILASVYSDHPDYDPAWETLPTRSVPG